MGKSNNDKNKSAAHAGMSQNDIRRAAKARRRGPRKLVSVSAIESNPFSMRDAIKEKRVAERERQEELIRRKRLGLTVNECIEAAFAATTRTGTAILHLFGDERFTTEVREQAAKEIIEWCSSEWNEHQAYDARLIGHGENERLMLVHIAAVKLVKQTA